MIRLIRLVFYSSLVFIFSCEKQGGYFYCSDCMEAEPIGAEIQVKLKFTNGAGVLIDIYEGNLEDNILLGTYIEYSTIFTTSVTLNKKYTITASYKIDGIDYLAVNSLTPRVREEKVRCKDPCFLVYDKVADLRLKYTK